MSAVPKLGSAAPPGWRSRGLFATLSVLAIAYGLIAAWLLTGGAPDLVGHTAAFLDFLVSPWMLATYVVAFSLIAFGAWHLSDRRTVDPERELKAAMRRTALQLALVWLLVALSLSGIGLLHTREIDRTSHAERAAQQQVVARFKAQQIGKWLVERAIDDDLLAASLARLPIDRLPGDRDVARLLELLFAETLAGNPDRVAITLFAPDGAVLVHMGESDDKSDGRIAEAARALAAAPLTAPRIVDVHEVAATPSHVRMAFLAPVVGRGPGKPMAAVLAMAVDPFRGFLEQVQLWPTPSESAQVLVVRRDGNDVVWITPPRLTAIAPDTYRRPLTDTALPAVQAVLQGDGVRLGRSLRGAEVLSASQRVNGVPWIVIAQTDEAEASQPLERRARMLAVIIAAAAVLAALMLFVLWRGEYDSRRREQQRGHAEHAAVRRHYAELTRLARDIVLMVDPDGRIIEANEAALAAYGYGADELYGLTVADLRTPEEMPKFDRQWHAGSGPDGVLFETVHRRRDGTSFPVEISGRAIDVKGRPYRQAFIRDISARRALEGQVARLSQVRSALQSATSALLRARSEEEIYRHVCEALVRLGDYLMASVAQPNDDPGRTVRFAAVAGVDDGYLAGAGISWGEGPRGQGPTGAALRSGKVQLNRDFMTNPALSSLREEASARGYRSSIALPLKDATRVFAALTLYARQPDAFDTDEVALLAALADDMAYAVICLRLRPAA